MFVKRITLWSTLGMCLIFLTLSTIGCNLPAQAQTVDSDIAKALRSLQGGQSVSGSNITSPVDASRGQQQGVQLGNPLLQSPQDQAQLQMLLQSQLQQQKEAEEPSPLESDYRSRMFDADQELRQRAEKQALQQRKQDIRDFGKAAADDLEAKDKPEQDPRLELKQFGYDIFSRPVTTSDLSIGRAPSDYVLGIGDQVVVNFRGSTENDYIVNVDSEGRLVIPSLAPINAAGRHFDDVEADIRSQTAASLLGTTAYVSLGSVRMVSVYVLGEVTVPGVIRLTSMSSALDALSLAGGVKKSGSLRDIRIVRGKEVHKVDLYNVLLGTGGVDLDIRDGDQIVVPPIGRTYAVTGKVTRVGIFELSPGQSRISVGDALTQAGGTLRPRGYAYVTNHVADDGRQVIRSVARASGELQSGDILHVSLMQDVKVGSVRVLGHVNVPGYVSLDAAPKLSDLISNTDLMKPDPYLPFAIVETTDPVTQARVLKAVNLEAALRGQADYTFKSSDWLYVFGMDDMKFLSSPLVQQVIVLGRLPTTKTESSSPPTLPNPDDQQQATQVRDLRQNLEQRAATTTDVLGSCRGLNRVARLVSDTRSERFASAIANAAFENFDDVQAATKCPDIYDLNDELLPFILEHVVAIHGSVRRPGIYPITVDTSLASLIQVAGGVMGTADQTSVEFMEFQASGTSGRSQITRHNIDMTKDDPAKIIVTPGSSIRFNQLLNQQESGGVLLSGEFVRPGFYTLRRGEKLSEVIERAGGLTHQAYPYGAVFTRESAKQAQREGFQRAARELNAALTYAAVKSNADARGLANIQATALQLQTVEAAGRVVIEADPTVLSVRPSLDVTLEPGDQLFMPKRPSSVTVVGDVLNPGTLQFVPGKSVRQYLKEAGGFQITADRSRVFIVYPNGAAEPYSTGFAGISGSPPLPPGTAIVVPKNLLPFDWRRFAVDMTQILSQLAISAVALHTISQ